MRIQSANITHLKLAPKATSCQASHYCSLPIRWALAILMIASCACVHAQTLGLQFHAGSVTNINSGFSGATTYFLGVAVDTSGNVYVADNYSETVYKETLSNGTYTKSVVMSGLTSYLGYLAVDTSGNVYITDQLGGPAHPGIGYKGIVYKATPSGSGYTTTTVTDTIPNPYGIAVDASGNLFISTYGQPAANGGVAIPQSVYKETPSGSSYVETAIVTSGLSNPQGVAVDRSGNLYIDDIQANHILKETPNGGTYTTSATITTVATNSAYGCLAVDAAGNLYVCGVGPTYVNTYSQLIYKLTLSDGPHGGNYFATPVGDFTGLPEGVAVDANQNIYMIAGTLYEASAPTANFGSVALGATSSVLSVPFTTDQGSIGNISVEAPTTDGVAGKDFTDAGTGTCDTNGLTHVYNWGETCTVNIQFKPSVAGTRNGGVQLLNSQGTPLATSYFTGNATGPQIAYGTRVQTTAISTGLKAPQGVAVDANGNLFIADTGNARVLKESLSGSTYTQSLVSQFGLKNISYLPTGIALDPAGLVYIGDGSNGRAAEFYLDFGTYLPQQIFTGIGYAQGVTTDTAGNLYVADSTNNLIWEASTLYSDIWSSVPGITVVSSLPLTGLSSPTGVAEDGSGNLYIADTGNNRVLKETMVAGSLMTSNVASYTQTVIGSGLSAPAGVAVDGVGNVYISDTGNNRVLEETLSGGNYTQSIVVSGLGGPTGLTIDGLGTLYVADTGNNRILKFGLGTIPTITFASTAVGSTSSDSPQTVTIQNVGNATLTLPIPSVGNTDPSISTNFTLSTTGSTACPSITSTSSSPGTLVAGASCTLPVSFIPTSTGNLSGSLTLTDNNLNVAASTQTIPLSGTGTSASAPVAVLSPSTVPFGSQTVNLTSGVQYVNLSNTGTASLSIGGVTLTGANTADFTYDATACGTSLAAGANCNISVFFTPLSAATFSATLSVADSATGSPQTVALTGTGTAVPAPVASLSPGGLTFASTAVGSTTASQTLTLSNTGNAALSSIVVSIVGSNPSDFAYTTNCGSSLVATSSCSIYVTFAPLSATSFSAVISVADNATGTPQTATLSGTGTPAPAPIATLTPTLAFGNQAEGTISATQTVTLSNTGNATLNITSTTLGGTNAANFAIQSKTCGTTLAQSSSCTILLTFSPTTTVSYAATLSVVDNATGSPQITVLSGTGTYVKPVVTFLPATLAFGNVTQGTTSAAQMVTLSNTGTSPFTVSGISISSGFADTSTCPTTLAPGANCNFSVTFTPGSTGSVNGTLQVTDTPDGLIESVTLSGTGSTIPAPQVVLAPTSLTFPATNTGTTSATQSITISNPGSAALTITGITLTGANASSFTQTNNCGTTLAALGTCTISVSFTPTATGPLTAAVSVADNAVGSPQTAALSGTGVNAATFTLAIANVPLPVNPGGVVQLTISVASLNGSYTNPVALAVTGLPAGAAATFSPASITPGVAGASSVLTIQTPANVASLEQHRHSNASWLALLLLPFSWMLRGKRLKRLPGTWLAVLMLSLVSLGLTACAGGYYGPKPQAYTLTVTGTSNSIQQSTTVVLTVE